MKNQFYLNVAAVAICSLNLTWAAEEVLVKFKPGNEAMAASLGLSQEKSEAYKELGVVKIELFDEKENAEDAAKRMNAYEEVEYAEPNYKRYNKPPDYSKKPVEISSNSASKKIQSSGGAFGKQWGLPKIQVDIGWGLGIGLNNVKVAVLDTGVEISHPDLMNQVTEGYDFTENTKKMVDNDSHGTHCAGVIAAYKAKDDGVMGVAHGCRIMPIRVLSNGTGHVSDVLKGINYAVKNGAKVLSMSLGSTYKSKFEEDAVKYAASKGVVLVAAAGNDSVDEKNYPAAHADVIAVAATNSLDKMSWFSNFGDWVEVAAPGEEIYSTVPFQKGNYGIHKEYDYMDGTSMATPHVAGLAGLILSVFPKATVKQVREIIQKGCDQVEGTGSSFAYGRINVQKSLEYALAKYNEQRLVAAAQVKIPKNNKALGDQKIYDMDFLINTFEGVNDDDNSHPRVETQSGQEKTKQIAKIKAKFEISKEKILSDQVAIQIRVNSDKEVQAGLYVYDWRDKSKKVAGKATKRGYYQLVKFPLTSSKAGTVVTAEIKDLKDKYLSTSGVIKCLIRAESGKQFKLTSDVARLIWR